MMGVWQEGKRVWTQTTPVCWFASQNAFPTYWESQQGSRISSASRADDTSCGSVCSLRGNTQTQRRHALTHTHKQLYFVAADRMPRPVAPSNFPKMHSPPPLMFGLGRRLGLYLNHQLPGFSPLTHTHDGSRVDFPKC